MDKRFSVPGALSGSPGSLRVFDLFAGFGTQRIEAIQSCLQICLHFLQSGELLFDEA